MDDEFDYEKYVNNLIFNFNLEEKDEKCSSCDGKSFVTIISISGEDEDEAYEDAYDEEEVEAEDEEDDEVDDEVEDEVEEEVEAEEAEDEINLSKNIKIYHMNIN